MKISRFFIILVLVFIYSCDEHVNTIEKIASKGDLPDMLIKDVFMNYSDSGKIKMKLSAPELISSKIGDTTHTLFEKGLRGFFYNQDDKIESSLWADYAKHNSKDDIWEYRENVVLVNEQMDTLRTDLLFANRKTERIYSDTIVTITRKDGSSITGSEGFDSDFAFKEYTFTKVIAMGSK